MRDELERERETLAGELGRAEEEKISCLREVEEVRQALVEADLRCGESETARQLLEGQVYKSDTRYIYPLSHRNLQITAITYHLKPSTVKAKYVPALYRTL